MYRVSYGKQIPNLPPRANATEKRRNITTRIYSTIPRPNKPTINPRGSLHILDEMRLKAPDTGKSWTDIYL